VSYYDATFGKRDYSAAFLVEPTNNYQSVYQYDPLGWVDNWGSGSETSWGANIFTAASSKKLAAVSFYASSGNFSYELYVYTGVTGGKPRSGTLRYNTSGTFNYAGYYTINLPSPVSLTSGQKCSIVVKFTTPGYGYPIPAESYYSGFSEDVTSKPGQSFMSTYGTSWVDVSADPVNKVNCCIKGFTEPVPTITVDTPTGGDSWYKGETKTIAWTKTGSQAANVNIQVRRGSANVKSIATGTANDGSFDWKIPNSISPRADYFVRVKTTDGKAKGDGNLFSIIAPTITVTSPNASTTWAKGANVTVNWTPVGPQNAYVDIQLWRSGTKVRDIALHTDNDGSVDWVVPTNLTANTGYYVRVKTIDNAVKDDSDKFAISN
jgi:hypothetical protein